MTMTRTEILDIWKGFVRNMSDQGAVVPFAHEIESRVRNELLDRLEAAEKECDALRARIEAKENALSDWHYANAHGGWIDNLRVKCDTLDAELKAAHAMALNGVEWRELAQKYEARIEEMERQEPVGEVVHNGESAGLYDILEQGALLYALPGAKGEEE